MTIKKLAMMITLVATAASFGSAPAMSNPPKRDTPQELFARMTAFDQKLFAAFNSCDIEKLTAFFVPALEFYHDNDGVSWSRDKFIGDVQKNVCGKFRRELVAGTLEVFPLGDYGALISGRHVFCKTGAPRCEGSGRFMHVLENKSGNWRVTRVISFDHRTISAEGK